MYTLTRKLSVVCLTVVLSFLVYGCGGSSKQITDVSTDMVTAGLTPDSGTYTIQPGGTATAGDVTFACPAEGSSCEVTVADDGTVTSAGGMATAMTSASAAARLAAQQAQQVAEDAQAAAEGDTAAAQQAQQVAEDAQAAAEQAQQVAEDAQAAAELAQAAAEGDTTAAQQAQQVAEDAQAAAELAQAAAEGDTAAAQQAQQVAEDAQAAAEQAQQVAEDAQAAAELAQAAAEGDTTTAQQAQQVAEDAQAAAELAQAAAEGDTAAAQQAQQVAEDAQATAEQAQQVAEDAQAAAELAQAAAEGDTTAAQQAQQVADDARADAEQAQQVAEDARADAEQAQQVAENALAVAEAALADAELALADAEEEARLLTTVTTITPTLAMGYGTVTAGVYRIEPGDNMVVDDAKITCPLEGAVICVVVVTVNEDGVTYVSLGGMATVVNSDSVTETREAVALSGFGAGTDGANVPGALIVDATAPTIDTADDGVKRSTDGSDITITLTHAGDNDYSSGETVGAGNRINGWPGQTFTRDDRATEDAMPMNNDDVTVYTNIESSTPQNLKYTAGMVPALSNTVTFVLDANQDDDGSLNTDIDMPSTVRSITGVFSGVPGAFTCAKTVACAEITTETNAGGQRVLMENIGAGWTFESDGPVESEATQDGDYLYFGYWLKSPVVSSEDPTNYDFGVIVGGRTSFEIESALSTNDDEALTATYDGRAAGMYVTRKLEIKDQIVDPQSPGYHGSFTARASLTANFGMHENFEADDETMRPDTRNTIEGSITDIMDGNMDLGFGKITLKRTPIQATGSMTGTTEANFGDTARNTGAPGTGTWSGQFYGPSADDLNVALRAANPGVDDSDLILAEDASTLPTGVAGQFNVSSNTGHTRVVGAFAAE